MRKFPDGPLAALAVCIVEVSARYVTYQDIGNLVANLSRVSIWAVLVCMAIYAGWRLVTSQRTAQ